MLRALPDDTGMAFVLVQHLDPTHASMMKEILGRVTRLPVRQVEHGMEIRPNHVYVIPPGTDMVISDGVLELSPRREGGQHHPIDLFLRSLAEVQGHKAIGVVLSGTGTDGTLGLEEIKAGGGITFAQDGTAQQDSMPRNAITAGCVDFVLPPEKIAEEIVRIARHPYVGPPVKKRHDQPATVEVDLGPVLELLCKGTGVDFGQYKFNTLYRRITRRMVLNRMEGLRDYVRFLRESPEEVEALFQDVLISVTGFFRDPEAFEAVKTRVFPRLTKERRHEPLRIWVLGCSTGEEAYSLAIAFTEFTELAGKSIPLQVFASDLNGAGIEKARAGIYQKNIVSDVSPERLRRFFSEQDGSYRISKSIRDLCVFARHNVLTDPPFSRIDFVSCRNMLIYLEPAIQQKIVPIMHYALQPKGFLWLGSSETIGSYRDLFDLEDPKHKLYSRKPSPARLPIHPAPVRSRKTNGHGRPHEPGNGPLEVQKEADRILLAKYAPSGVLVDHDLEILQFRGDTGMYLTPAPGRASHNLLKMLREGLLVAVRGAIARARKEMTPVREVDLRVRSNGGHRPVDVEVLPIKSPSGTLHFLILFHPHAPEAVPPSGTKPRKPLPSPAESSEEVERDQARVKQELAATREYLQSVIEQQEAANEELQSANEEVQSTNEELQSINEELETSKEEIQSSNEELATVNDELQNRNAELSQSNNDLMNLLSSVKMAIVMVGHDFRIRRFTPIAQKMLNLIPADVGRPFSDIKLNVDVPDLEQLLVQTVETVTGTERLVQDREGHWYSLRLRPYRTFENKVEGAVIVFIDVDDLKRAEESLRASEERLRIVQDQAPVGIRETDLDGRIVRVNDRFCQLTGYSREELLGRRIQDFVYPDDQQAELAHFRQVLSGEVASYWMVQRLINKKGEVLPVELHGFAVRDAAGKTQFGVGIVLDITHRRRLEKDLTQKLQELAAADQKKNMILATLAHELRNPLAAIRNSVQALASAGENAEMVDRARAMIERQTRNMVRMVDDLLDVSRLTRGLIQLQRENLDFSSLVRECVEGIRHVIENRGQTVDLSLPGEALWVHADPTRLEQVVDNLLQNASKFSRKGGHVRVSVARSAPKDRLAVLRVQDDGQGIDPALLPHVFEGFMQADSTLARSQGGLGLGLTLVRSLVELHGGAVEAHSEGVGKGSEFVVRLPLSEKTEPTTKAQPAPPGGRARGPSRRILIVDDNEDSARSLEMLLQLAGHEVLLAGDGPGALEEAQRSRPEVILLDIGLPGMDGYEVARQLRGKNASPRPAIVALTGYGQEQDRNEALNAGFDLHMIKPVDHQELCDWLASLEMPGA